MEERISEIRMRRDRVQKKGEAASQPGGTGRRKTASPGLTESPQDLTGTGRWPMLWTPQLKSTASPETIPSGPSPQYVSALP